eukprot:UN27602
MTWGHLTYGGDVSLVKDDLNSNHIVNVLSNEFSFAAITETNKIISWGGGDNDMAYNPKQKHDVRRTLKIETTAMRWVNESERLLKEFFESRFMTKKLSSKFEADNWIGEPIGLHCSDREYC